MTDTAKKHVLDFTNVKDSSGINPKHVEAGDYGARIIAVTETLKDDVPMWRFDFQLHDMKSAVYPYYCKLQENQLWKLRNMLIAAGIQVPKKKVGVDPNKLVNKDVAITLDDEEYEDKMKSAIEAVFPISELDSPEPAGATSSDDEADEEPDVAEGDDEELDIDDL